MIAHDDIAPEAVRVVGVKTQRSTKERICDACGGIIRAGEQYRSVATIDGKDFTLLSEHIDRAACNASSRPCSPDSGSF